MPRRNGEFTLKDVLSQRICDSVDGWRDRAEEERLCLSARQKESFLKLFGHGARQRTKGSLEAFITSPHHIRGYGDYFERIYWAGDDCRYCAGGSYPDEIARIRRAIANS